MATWRSASLCAKSTQCKPPQCGGCCIMLQHHHRHHIRIATSLSATPSSHASPPTSSSSSSSSTDFRSHPASSLTKNDPQLLTSIHPTPATIPSTATPTTPDTSSFSLPTPTFPSATSEVVIILVEPKRGENIGAAARAMKNFGLRELRLIRPGAGATVENSGATDGGEGVGVGGEWPIEKARAVAARAVNLLDGARVYDSLDEALSDLQFVFAASGRPRAQDKLSKDVVMLRQLQEALPPTGTRVGIMFGREDNGLYNEELVRANAILTIDTDPSFYSLNLGQAVLIVCYELFRAPRRPDLGAKRVPASRREVEGMLGWLFGSLESRGFFTPFNRQVLQFAIRGFFDRIKPSLSRQDVAAVRQVLKGLLRGPIPPPSQPPPSPAPPPDGNISQTPPPP